MAHEATIATPNSDEEFEICLMSSDIPVVVHFFNQTDPKLNTMAPVFSSLATKFKDKFLFIDINATILNETATRYGVETFPTFKFYLQGEEVHCVNVPPTLFSAMHLTK